ncbi:MAG: hypothetical protein AB7I59_27210, partial [Geminicoccaceae bacterium]
KQVDSLRHDHLAPNQPRELNGLMNVVQVGGPVPSESPVQVLDLAGIVGGSQRVMDATRPKSKHSHGSKPSP